MGRARGGVPSVGVVKRRVLRGLWRRLVGGVGSYGLYNAPPGRAVFSPSYSVRPSLYVLEPLRTSVCRATMTTPGVAGTLLPSIRGRAQLPYVFGAPVSLIGSELSDPTI